ncbi:MAG TPA: TlpA family protein disulfide reductase [Nitrospirae bacterium]|nr:TlpA family protein disulfide reductase [Nitrospirota bacterium]
MPSLENLHQHFKDKPFTLLSIDVGESGDTVREFISKQDMSFTVLLDEDTQVSSKFGVRSHPMKFLIDKKGNIAGVAFGYREWDDDEMKSLITLFIDSNA